jgi:hypothetical protein
MEIMLLTYYALFQLLLRYENVRVKLDPRQSVQIGWILNQWAIVYFGKCFENRMSSPHFWATLTQIYITYVLLILTKKNTWGDFFTNSSGHPVTWLRTNCAQKCQSRFLWQRDEFFRIFAAKKSNCRKKVVHVKKQNKSVSFFVAVGSIKWIRFDTTCCVQVQR